MDVTVMPTNVHKVTDCAPSLQKLRCKRTIRWRGVWIANSVGESNWGNGGGGDGQTCDDVRPHQSGVHCLV